MNCTVQMTQGRLRHLGRTQIAAHSGGGRDESHRPAGSRSSSTIICSVVDSAAASRFDGTVRAVQIAKQVDGPVQGDLDARGRHPARHVPPVLLRPLSAGVDAQGKAVAGRIASPARRSSRATSPPYSRTASIPTRSRLGESALRAQRHSCRLGRAGTARNPDRLLAWRRVTRGTFAVESFIDELAANAKQDPLAYRVALLDKNPRAKAVLQIAAEKSGWGKPLPKGRAAGSRCAPASAASSRRSFR